MENIDSPVVIAGAGPVGLALALGLARGGIKTIVLEQNPTLSEFSKAAAVLPRTLEIFHNWGVADLFKKNGRWLGYVQVRDKNNHPVFKVHFDLLKDESPAAAICLIAQNESERLLYKALQATGMSEVRFANKLIAFEERDGGIISRISAGGSEYLLRSKFLCGCDGPRSSVRMQLGMELVGKTYNAHALLADIKTKNEESEDAPVRVDLNSWGVNAMLNFQPKVWRLILALPGSVPESVPIDLVHERVATMIGVTDFEILWSSTFKIHCRNAAKFRVGKVVLLGDAAHLNSPAGGQGMNSGIQDAHNLAWKLGAILKGGNEEELLQSYDIERQDAIRNSVDVFTDRLTKVAITCPPIIRWVVIKTFSLLLHLRKFAYTAVRGTGMLNLRYKPGPLIDASGGMLVKNRIESNGNARLSEIAGEYVVVRPDDVIAYQGRDKTRAESFYSKISSTR
jgi:2-polyprenyl-6-methoxyphenol hydroxylase-like FAD-dependent oxidoreductase